MNGVCRRCLPRDRAERLLLDESLSERLLPQLAEPFPGSDHVRRLRGCGVPDRLLWDLALAGEFVLVTRDEDYLGWSVLRGMPPKVVWLDAGTRAARHAVIAALLQSHGPDIERFASHDEHAFLAVGFYTAASTRVMERRLPAGAL